MDIDKSLDRIKQLLDIASELQKRERVLRLALQLLTHEYAQNIHNPTDLQKCVPEFWIMKAQERIEFP